MGEYANGGGVAASQQFGANQTDVFVVDGSNRLNLYSAIGDGHWQGPQMIGPSPAFAEGSLPAVCQRNGHDQTDVFLIDGQGALNVLWVDGQGQWRGPQRISAVGFNSAEIPNGLVSAPAASIRYGTSDQTDVFAIDGSGQLHVFSIMGTGSWSGPQKIGPPNFFYSPSPAITQRFGVPDQTNLFVVDQNGQLNLFWATGAGGWNGPQKIGNPGVFPAACCVAVSNQFGIAGQTDVFMIDNSGYLNVLWVNGLGSWNGPKRISSTGNLPAGGFVAASQQFGIADQTNVYVVDLQGQLSVFSVDGSGAWTGPLTIGNPGAFEAGAAIAVSPLYGISNQTNLYLVDKNGVLNICTLDSPGAWSGPSPINPPAPTPSRFGSNRNYIIANVLDHNCAPITDLKVTILITEDIICSAASGSNSGPNWFGYSFQLDCYSPKNFEAAVQQFAFSLLYSRDPLNTKSGLNCYIDTWTISGGAVIQYEAGLAYLSSGSLLAGYSLEIALQNISNGFITGATFTAYDNVGNQICNSTQTMLEAGQSNFAQLAPVIACEFAIIGPRNSEKVVLSSGAGSITYASSSTLVALTALPSCVQAPNIITLETANTVYGTLPADPAQSLSQSFTTTNG
jgi:hypothetical protein